MRLRNGMFGAAAAVLVAAVVPAFTSTVQAQQPITLRVGVTQEVDSLNPFIAILRTSTDILRASFEYLTVYSQRDQAPAEGLAEKWETSPDKLTWTFTIRQGATWSDGQPITAKDAAFTFNLMLTNEVARTANGSYVSTWDSVSAPDDRTLVIKTKKPQATMLALDIPIVPEHVWSKITDVGGKPAMPMVGSGPFTITEFKESQFTKLKANKNYWRGAPKIDELQFVYYKNSDAAVQALRNGEIDLVNRLTPAQFDALKGDSNIGLNNARHRRFNEILLNPGAATNTGEPIGDGHPALKDVAVRAAIAQAIDSKTLVDKVWGGYAIEGGGYIPPVFADFHWQPPEGVKRKFDLAAANRALDEAGYPRGGDGIRVGKDGRPLKFRLLGHAGANFDEQSSEYIKRWLADIGIPVEVQLVSDNKLNEATTAANFDLAYSGWNANPDPDYVLSLQTCANRPNAQGKGGTPDSFLCDQQYDSLYAQQLSEFDRTKRIELVKKMQERLYDQATLVVLGYDNALEAYRKDRFTSFPVQPEPGGVIMNQQGYWGYYGATPAQATANGGGSNTGLILGIGVGVLVVLVAAGLLFARRRRATAEERE